MAASQRAELGASNVRLIKDKAARWGGYSRRRFSSNCTATDFLLLVICG